MIIGSVFGLLVGLILFISAFGTANNRREEKTNWTVWIIPEESCWWKNMAGSVLVSLLAALSLAFLPIPI